ncbi:hypothetical protein E1B28_005621 [Marasmius oreades]|uniref:FAD-binding PCMH-type domain-containing protein n=1 Tax=Marasmius oreades TaxID=181124 RepID=A0A9P7S426_9AGAR|nr:uncharacterized protein E1B28_005621 [Marasmius oreades]KAG7094808.1 hypothetical protein E1B28_005621 [Marasmius oreades]
MSSRTGEMAPRRIPRVASVFCNGSAFSKEKLRSFRPSRTSMSNWFISAEHNIRFVVKNSGHDTLGRSSGTGAVSVWMHNLQDITFISEYKSSIYTGPAFKAHAGVRSIDIANAASNRGLVVVSGGCPTVGFTGGFIQGGGQSAVSSFYGLAADQTLEFEVITTQGKFIHASPTENQDLYWALSGSGGGAHGIVWSVTVKAYEDLPVSLGSISFTSEGITQETFFQAIDTFHANTPRFADAKVWTIAQYTGGFFSLNPVFAVNKTSAEVSTLLRPLLDTLDSLGVKYASDVESYDGYLAAYETLVVLINVPIGVMVTGSRLLPTSLFEDKERLKGAQKAIRSILASGGMIFEFVLKATLDVAGNPQNSVLPAWRKAIKHLGVAIPLADGESSEQVSHKRRKITTEFLPELKRLTPGSGSYHNEADPNDPDYKEAFYGSNYDKLLAIKDKWDPDQILYGATSVGGDRWRETVEGRLCRNEEYEDLLHDEL